MAQFYRGNNWAPGEQVVAQECPIILFPVGRKIPVCAYPEVQH